MVKSIDARKVDRFATVSRRFEVLSLVSAFFSAGGSACGGGTGGSKRPPWVNILRGVIIRFGETQIDGLHRLRPVGDGRTRFDTARFH